MDIFQNLGFIQSTIDDVPPQYHMIQTIYLVSKEINHKLRQENVKEITKHGTYKYY